MTRSLTINGTNGVATVEGVESVLLVRIVWSIGRLYGSKSISPYKGRIVGFSGINSSKKSINTSSIGTVTISLSDPDSSIKNLIDTHSLEGVEVKVYQYFDGLSGSDPTEIFTGHIINPVDYNEGQQEAILQIESYISKNKVGHILEEGQLARQNSKSIGKMIPLVFGKPAHVPAILLQQQPRTILSASITFAGDKDANLYELYTKVYEGHPYYNLRLKDLKDIETYRFENDVTHIETGKIYVEDSSDFPQNTLIDISIDGVIFKGRFNGNTFTIEEANAPKYINITPAARPSSLTNPDSANPKIFYLDDTNKNLINTYIRIYKDDFTNIETHGADYIERKIVHQENGKCWLDEVLYEAGTNDSYLLMGLNEDNILIREVRGLSHSGFRSNIAQKEINKMSQILAARQERVREPDPNPLVNEHSLSVLIDFLNLTRDLKKLFWSRGEGSIVHQWGANPDVYVVNAVASNSVTAVYGIREFYGKLHFVPIPSSLFTININNTSLVPLTGSLPTNLTTLSFNEPLELIKGQGWKDEIYVTVDSTISSNTSVAIKYILDTHTNLSTNTSSFSSVESDIANYPSHFAIFEQWDAMSLCENIAWQARCGLLIDSNEIKIRYLSKSPSSDLTINENDVEFGTGVISHTNSDELVTYLIGKWIKSYRPETDLNKKDEFEYIYTNNIDDHGVIEDTYDFFIYNIKSLVQKSLDFWGGRYSNIWKTFSFIGFHTALKIEVFDTMGFQLDIINNAGTTNGVVEAVNNKVITGVMQFRCWLPHLAGTTVTSSLAWISDANDVFPINPSDDFTLMDYHVGYENIRDELGTDEALKIFEDLRSKMRVDAVIIDIAPELS